MLWLFSVAFADYAPYVDSCEYEGDRCSIEDTAGTCDSALECVSKEDSKGCSTTGRAGAAAMVGLGLGVLALRPRRAPSPATSLQHP